VSDFECDKNFSSNCLIDIIYLIMRNHNPLVRVQIPDSPPIKKRISVERQSFFIARQYFQIKIRPRRRGKLGRSCNIPIPADGINHL